MSHIFPNFRRLSIDDKKDIDGFVRQFPPYSDFNFVSLWSYNILDKVELSYLYNNLVVFFTDYLNGEQFYSFLGVNKVREVSQILLDHARKQNVIKDLKLIPEIVIKADPSLLKTFQVDEDRDNFDYIYSIDDIVKLGGADYSLKRWRLNHFARKYAGYTVKPLNVYDKTTQQAMLSIFEEWAKTKRKSDKEIHHELTAFKRLLTVASILDLVALGIFYQNRMIAFSVNESIHDNYMQGHFAKYNPDFKFIVEVLHHHSFKHIHGKGKMYFNLEQDMGLINLRIAKTSWKPAFFLKKYIISQK